MIGPNLKSLRFLYVLCVLLETLKSPGGKTNIQIEQVGKGGLPPLFPEHSDEARAGVNHPSRLVQFVVSSCYLLGLYKQGNFAVKLYEHQGTTETPSTQRKRREELLLIILLLSLSLSVAAQSSEWPYYGGDSGGNRYS